MKPCAIICLILGIWVVCLGTAGAETDPWQVLRAKFLPFSSQEENLARHQGVHARTFQDRFDVRLAPYETTIDTASRRFDIPRVLLQAVIMAESGGNPKARAGITSAKGLMQTIDSTFSMARAGLSERGFHIPDNPFDPEASIMAGAWYLDRMYHQALSDGKMAKEDRKDIDSWRYPLEYYYAGPGKGIRAENKIQVYSNGESRIIDKRAYSGKIQSWAKILAAS
jgi:hypothetical protein